MTVTANAPGASSSREIAGFYIHWQVFVNENLHTLALPFREILDLIGKLSSTVIS